MNSKTVSKSAWMKTHKSVVRDITSNKVLTRESP
jgi:hypothetical protein